MSKFHVGDRWLDDHGREWVIGDIIGTNRAISAGHGTMRTFDQNGCHKLSGSRLVRLVSSERWIPFTEMMPEPPAEGDKRYLLLGSTDDPEPEWIRFSEAESAWDDGYGNGPEEWTEDGRCDVWRYIQPPEAT